MLHLDSNNGTIKWQKYVISPDLTYDEFSNRFPELSIKTVHNMPNNKLHLEISLPDIQIDGHEWSLTISFLSQQVNSLRFSSAEVDRLNYADGEEIQWLEKSIEWIEIAKEVFSEQLGKPISTEWKSYFLYDEADYLSPSQLEKLKISWEYTFSWGHAYLEYITQEPGGISASIFYNRR